MKGFEDFDLTYTEYWLKQQDDISNHPADTGPIAFSITSVPSAEETSPKDVQRGILKNGQGGKRRRLISNLSATVKSPDEAELLGGESFHCGHMHKAPLDRSLAILKLKRHRRMPSLSSHHNARQQWAYYRRYITYFPRNTVRVFSAPTLVSNIIRPRKKHPLRFKKLLAEIWSTVQDDFHLLTNPRFLLFWLSNLLLYSFYDIPYVNVPDYAKERGISGDSASLLVSVVGILNTVGMLLFGFLADQKWVNSVLLYASCISICGFSVLLLPWMEQFWHLCLCSSLFGFFISANYALASVILVDLISLSSFVNSYGMLCLVQGVGTFMGPALAGMRIYKLSLSVVISFSFTSISNHSPIKPYGRIIIMDYGNYNTSTLYVIS